MLGDFDSGFGAGFGNGIGMRVAKATATRAIIRVNTAIAKMSFFIFVATIESNCEFLAGLEMFKNLFEDWLNIPPAFVVGVVLEVAESVDIEPSGNSSWI